MVSGKSTFLFCSASFLMAVLPSVGHGQTDGFQLPPPAVSAAFALQGNKNAAAEDSISSLEVFQNADGQWVAVCQLTLNGRQYWRNLTIEATNEPNPRKTLRVVGPASKIDGKPDVQSKTIELERPDNFSDAYNADLQIVERTQKPVRTEWVVANLTGFSINGSPIEVSKVIKQTIQWPDKRIWDADKTIRIEGPAKSLEKAVKFIDEGSLDSARLLLERLLLRDGKLTAAYIEMARVAMKANWGAEGLLQAQRYLVSALQIDTENSNALILRGYVSAHQGRYKDAEADFAKVSPSNPPNLWLWSNWGEVFVMQGKTDEAIKMYLKGVSYPVTHDTYDRARQDAYRNLISIYEKKRDVEAMDRMHQSRVRDYSTNDCYGVEYGLFKLQGRGDASAAIELLKDLTQANCGNADSKEILGMAYYTKWAQSSEAEGIDSLNRARVYFPPGARLFYRLAKSNLTVEAAKRLMKVGDAIDQKDNRGMTALAIALERHEIETTRRLLNIGASPIITIGAVGMPLALIPVFQSDLEGIRLMKQVGINYSKINFQGVTAIDYARRLGNPKVIEVLNKQPSKT